MFAWSECSWQRHWSCHHVACIRHECIAMGKTWIIVLYSIWAHHWPKAWPPHFYAILQTVTQFRQYCQPHLAYEVLDLLTCQPPARYLPGPCGVFLTRLHKVNWKWDGNGFVTDHEGFRLHLLDAPLQLVRERLAHAWAASVGHSMASRAEFHGLADVDTACSNHTSQFFSHVDQGLLRVAMNGSFYTRDKQFSSGKFTSKQCPWCDCEDSVMHRTWQCIHFQTERNQMDPSIRKYIMSHPDCTRLHGWFTESAADHDFRKALLTIRDSTATFEHFTAMPKVLHLFTDGSGTDPTKDICDHLRMVTWPVCLAMLPDAGFPPAAAGGVPGILQTVLRAEITAVIAACRFGVHHHKPFYIWTWADCQVVFDRVQVMLSQENFAVTPRQKDHDLWQTLQTLVLRAKAMGLFHKILKVTSHQAHTEYSSLVDRWAIEGNEAADAAATWARTLLPTAVLQAHRRLQVESEQR